MPPVTPLLVQAQFALGLTQETLGALLGVSRRTVSRWGGGSSPTPSQLKTLAHALVPVDASLAEAIAQTQKASLVSWGLVAPPAPVPPAAPASAAPVIPVRCMADSIVCVAAEAAGMTPAQVRPLLVAAFMRASELKVTARDVVEGLAGDGRG